MDEPGHIQGVFSYNSHKPMPHELLYVWLISVPVSDLWDAMGPVLRVDMAVRFGVEIQHIPVPVRYIPTAVAH
jgi:hypothetical protein